MSEPTPKKPEQPMRLAVAYFRESVVLVSEVSSASVGNAGSNCVDSILPAIMLPDGASRPTREVERPDGLLITKRYHDAQTNKRAVRQTFVPWASVRCVGYAAE